MKKWTLTTTLALFAVGAIAQTPHQTMAELIRTDDRAKSIYERAGGINKIAMFIDQCVETEGTDETLLMNPRFKAAYANVPKPALKFMLTSYLASKWGGPQKYGGPDIAVLVKWFDFDMKQNDRAWSLRMAAMMKAEVPTDTQMEIRNWFDKEVMKAKAMAPMPETFKDKNGLYARLGGIVPIAVVTDEFINQLSTDSTIGGNSNVVRSLSEGKVSGAGLKFLVTEQLASAAGGPWKYSGRDMRESHKGLGISEKEWEAGAAILKRVLDKFMVPAKEQGEIFSVISSTKKDIVGG